MVRYGKMVIIEFSDKEEDKLQGFLEYLSKEMMIIPITKKNNLSELSLNPYTRIANNKNGQPIYLTAKEFDLLYFLYSHKGQVFTKEQLYEKVWGYDDVTDGRNLTSFIRKLRKKIEPVPDNPQYIITVWGVGYKFNEEKP